MNLKQRQQLFKEPTKEYRGKPFWSWNGKLEKEELLRQINVMKEMGFGGYFMHSRTGLETEYLGEEWFDLINACADYGYQQDMESWLYDEDRWPSGSAGGLVTKEEKYRAMFLEMNILSEQAWKEYSYDNHTVVVFALKLSDGIFSEKRIMIKGENLRDGETAVEFRTRYSSCNDNYNGYCYLNTMNKEAVQKYLEITHEKYRQKCGKRLGKEVYGIFTDEPHRGGIFTDFAEGEVNAVPYTPGILEAFEKKFGYSLKEHLPELFLRKRKGDLSKTTRDYFELCQELFLECFAIPVYEWCKKNHLIFTGHVLHEDSLCAQSAMQGSLMRFYEYMDYPGVDVLSEGNTCYWIVKQVQSVARQLDKKWILSELYGCTGWQMDFAAYKNVGDWQTLFGVNLRCPHLSWYTMKGEAKRDYPASILHQSAWYKEYCYLEDYYSRIHVALHEGKSACKLLVLNPVESVWARAYSGCFQGLDAADKEIQKLEKKYAQVFEMLLHNQIDFDYGEEDIIGRHGRVENGTLYVGCCGYTKVLVSGMDTMRRSTLELLKEFVRQGGNVIFSGELPTCVDVIQSDEIQNFANECSKIPFEEEALVKACAIGNEVKISSIQKHHIYTQTSYVNGGRFIMILNTDRENSCDELEINLGEGQYLELWNARNGRVVVPDYEVVNGEIILHLDIEAGGERIYLIGDEERMLPHTELPKRQKSVAIPDTFRYKLTEKNIYVLDQVSVSDDKGISLPCMEVLKADRAFREVYKIPYRGGEMLQPWYQVKYYGKETAFVSNVNLVYKFNVEQIQTDIHLVVENLENIQQIKINGEEIELVSVGKWIDICFDELNIPKKFLRIGENNISITMKYMSTNGIEAVYLLGYFGVRMEKNNCSIISLPETLRIGDITDQGFPFYSGSIIYYIDDLQKDTVEICVKDFGGALVKVIGDSDEIIAFPPYKTSVTGLKAIEIVLNRRNTFGPLHEIPRKARAYGPYNFITEGENWSENYVLYEQGLLKMPVILK